MFLQEVDDFSYQPILSLVLMPTNEERKKFLMQFYKLNFTSFNLKSTEFTNRKANAFWSLSVNPFEASKMATCGCVVSWYRPFSWPNHELERMVYCWVQFEQVHKWESFTASSLLTVFFDECFFAWDLGLAWTIKLRILLYFYSYVFTNL